MINNFLEDISKKGVIEYCKITQKACIVINKEEAFSNKKENIYFLGGTKGIGRSKDEDTEGISYLRFDIDIFSNCEKDLGYTPTQDDLDYLISHLKEELENTYFSNWRYIVKSGRGIHLYFCGDYLEIDNVTFSLGMKRLFRYFDSIFTVNNKQFKTDFACSNISRIMRLPGSINQKNGEECKIIYFQEKMINLEILKGFAKKEEIELEEKKRLIIEENSKKQLIFNDSNDNNFYDEINKIPAYMIAQLLIPEFPINRNLKNFDNSKGGFTGYFYIEEINGIANGGSRHFNYGGVNSCYNPFLLVKNFKGYSNKETFEFFRYILKK